MRSAAFILIILTCTLSSCIKPPDYAIVPHIEFVSVSSPVAFSSYSDTITFSFTDGDGDIGVPSTNIYDTVTDCNTCGIKTGDSSCLRLQAFNIFMIDSRDSCISTFASASVQPTGKYKGISGTIQVIAGMSNTKCFGGCSSSCTVNDTVTYAIILRDIAGHFSNTIHTIPIIITCPQ
jgi:hypothetical protein